MSRYYTNLFSVSRGRLSWLVLLLFVFMATGFNSTFLAAKEIAKEAPKKVELALSVKYYKYGSELQKLETRNSIQQDSVIFDNSNFLGGFFSGASPTEQVQDWGTSPGGMVTGMEIGVATASPLINVTIIIYQGTTDTEVGTVLATIQLDSLEGSTDGSLSGFSYEIALGTEEQFELPEGPFGYSYTTEDADGPLTANGGDGITDGFRVLPDETVFGFSSGFAQFWMKLTGVANEVIVVDPPANDECDSATVVSTFPFTDSLDTRGATSNPADPQLSCNSDGLQTDGNTVWYVWTADVTKTVNVSTIGSNYDTAHGIYTGDCGNLTEVECVDIGIDDDLIFDAVAGTTYFIKVGEFLGGSGGGNLVFSIQDPPALYQGPATGSATTGVAVNTDDFTGNKASRIVSRKRDHNTYKPKLINRSKPVVQPLGPVGSNFVQDLSATPKNKSNTVLNAPFLEKGFSGIDDTGSIPPDCILAAGPDHVVALVNSEIGIFDKTTGERLKLINGDDWYANILPGSGICDPQIIYDHFSSRWVMLWIECGSLDPTLLISISDDADPLGAWCSYSIPGDVNGDSERLGFFNDFPKMGLDDKAIYVMSNMFDLNGGGGFQYVQIRVIGKSQLYEAACGGTVTWTDMWDLRDPTTFTTTFTTAPYLAFENTTEAYFVDVEFSNIGTYLNLWTLTDPLGTPAFTAVSVPVTAFTQPEAPDQRGGSTIPFEGGGRTIRQSVAYRGGDLWVSRGVGNENGEYARANYTRIDVATKTAEEDVAFGADGFWYFYPANTVDANKNMIMTFTRTGENEFASARYTGRRDTDDPGLQTSALLKSGEANYSKDFGGGRNRWGDYSGIAVDPDGQSVWMLTEYAKAPSSTWGTWIGNVSYNAPAGVQIVSDPDSIDFDAVAVGDTTLSSTVTVQNSGQSDLTITDISLSSGANGFELQNLPTLPATLTSFQGFEFTVTFTAVTDVLATNEIVISSNDATVTIPLTGKTPAKLSLAQTSFDVTTDVSATTSISFSIENTGGDNLDYEIGFTGLAEFRPPASSTKAQKSPGLNGKSNDFSGLSSAVKAKLDLEKSNETASAAQAVPASTLFQYDVSTPANEIFAFAVDFDGTNILVAGGGQNGDASDANRLLVYDLNGNLISEFEQGNDANSAIGWRDMAVVDDTLLYGMDQESAEIQEFNLNSGAPTGQVIASPNSDINLRALGYDPATDHFWLSGLGLNIFEIDRQSNIINEFANSDGLNIRGLGWDDVSPGGPFLWVWADGDPSTQALLFDPVAGEFTGVGFDGALLGNNIAGGAMFTYHLPTSPGGTSVFLALHQNVPNFDVVAAYAVPPFWLTGATPAEGFIASGASENIEVSIDAVHLRHGEFKGGVVVGTSDATQPVAVIEINLTNTFGTSVESGSIIPDAFALEQNYPNPFNPETKIRYTIPEQNHVTVAVFNILGQKIRTLVDEVQIANTHEISWNGKNDDGQIQPTGVYIIRLRAGKFGETIKMLFVK